MKKFDAITKLVNGECDIIKNDYDAFHLDENKSIVNKNGYMMATTNMEEEGWECIVLDKWYEKLKDGPILCKRADGAVAVIYSISTKGNFLDYSGTVFGKLDSGDVEPVQKEEAEQYVYFDTQKDEIECDIVSFDGTPPTVEKAKKRFIDLGLPEEEWEVFWKKNNFDAILIEEVLKLDDTYCKMLIKEHVEGHEKEIPF